MNTYSKAMGIIESINDADEIEILEFDFDDCFNYMRQMEEAMKEFVERVNKGEVRSRKTYNKFKEILAETVN